jgi:hypothetical protein
VKAIEVRELWARSYQMVYGTSRHARSEGGEGAAEGVGDALRKAWKIAEGFGPVAAGYRIPDLPPKAGSANAPGYADPVVNPHPRDKALIWRITD